MLSPSPPPEDELRGISAGLENLYLNAVSNYTGYSDLVAKSGRHTWQVNRDLMCSKSSYFRSCYIPDVNMDTAEYDMESERDPRGPGEEEVVLREQEEPEIITRMLFWCYHSDYHNAEQRTFGQKAIIDAKMHNIAERYGFDLLMYEADENMGKNLALAIEHMVKDEKELDEIDNVVEAIKAAFSRGPGRAGATVLRALRHHLRWLHCLDEFRDLVREGGDFAVGILEEWADANYNRDSVCNKCSFKAKYQYAKTKQILYCSCCSTKFGAFLRYPHL